MAASPRASCMIVTAILLVCCVSMYSASQDWRQKLYANGNDTPQRWGQTGNGQLSQQQGQQGGFGGMQPAQPGPNMPRDMTMLPQDQAGQFMPQLQQQPQLSQAFPQGGGGGFGDQAGAPFLGAPHPSADTTQVQMDLGPRQLVPLQPNAAAKQIPLAYQYGLPPPPIELPPCFMFILIRSSANDKGRKARMVIRSSWLLESTLTTPFPICYAFIIAQPEKEANLRLIRPEISKFKDLVLHPYAISGRPSHTAMDTLVGMQVALDYWKPKFVLRVEDNIALAAQPVATLLQAACGEIADCGASQTYWGDLEEGAALAEVEDHPPPTILGTSRPVAGPRVYALSADLVAQVLGAPRDSEDAETHRQDHQIVAAVMSSLGVPPRQMAQGRLGGRKGEFCCVTVATKLLMRSPFLARQIKKNHLEGVDYWSRQSHIKPVMFSMVHQDDMSKFGSYFQGGYDKENLVAVCNIGDEPPGKRICNRKVA